MDCQRTAAAENSHTDVRIGKGWELFNVYYKPPTIVFYGSSHASVSTQSHRARAYLRTGGALSHLVASRWAGVFLVTRAHT